jgi:hypothetical protein
MGDSSDEEPEEYECQPREFPAIDSFELPGCQVSRGCRHVGSILAAIPRVPDCRNIYADGMVHGFLQKRGLVPDAQRATEGIARAAK